MKATTAEKAPQPSVSPRASLTLATCHARELVLGLQKEQFVLEEIDRC